MGEPTRERVRAPTFEPSEPDRSAAMMHARISRERVCVVLMALCVFGIGAVYVLAVRTVRGQEFEISALDGRSVQPLRLETAAEVLLRTVDVAALAAIVALAVMLALVRRNVRLACVVALIVGGATSTTEALKLKLLTRPDLLGFRPDLIGQLDQRSPENTLPSGHTTVAMCLVVAVVLVVPRRLQGIVAVLGAPYPIGIGIGTMLAGWHRPSDVVAACLVVGFWTFGGVLLLDWAGAMRRDTREPWERFVAPAIVVGLVLTVASLAATSLYGLRFHLEQFSNVGRRDELRVTLAFGFSAASIATVATLVIAALLWVLRDVRLAR